jgi:SRSO17 transposase
MVGMVNIEDSARQRFEQYLALLSVIAGHADRGRPLRAYLTGLCLPGDRKSIEPMAARIDPRHVSSRHQSMHHVVANAQWDDAAVLRLARNTVLEAMERHGAMAGWIVDDTGIPKKGRQSVGVARQYCGVLGKQDNCQVAVSLTLANEAGSVPVAYRLYLPESWARDSQRRLAAGVPKQVRFQTKWHMALDMIDRLRVEGLPAAPILADAAYGVVTAFREGLTERKIPYVVGISSETTVWPPGLAPVPPKRRSRIGRPPSRMRRSATRQPAAVLALAKHAPKNRWTETCWREGTRGKMSSRFVWLRVRPAHRDENRHEPRDIEWLIAEWPDGESEPTKFWLSTMSPDTPAEQLIRLAKLRWRIERDYEELKGSFGLDHYEGRGWRGFHHHGSLCIAAYAFLAAERARLSPPEPLSFLRPAPVPRGFKPRGAASAA